MIAEQWEQIKELFEGALDCSPAERPSFLSRLAQRDPAIASQVAELVASFEQAGDFLLQPCCVSSDFLEDLELEVEQQRFSPDDVLCGRFRIVNLIGRGGMGEVYKAWDEELEDHIALKTLRLEISTHELFTSRFRRELQLARKVTHPNVCRIFDSFKHPVGDGTYISVLSMELLQGQTLADYLKAKGRLTAVEALPIAQQIIAGLSAIHAAGIVHRDLKPANLILVPENGAAKNNPAQSSTNNEVVDHLTQGAKAKAAESRATSFLIKITDFGIAGRQPDGLSQAAQTEVSKLLGTPDYMAPEQLEHTRANIQSDIYSLGLVLYEMVTGVKPFANASAWKRTTAEAPSARKLAGDLPENWNHVIECSLQRKPAKRPGSTSEMLRLFDARVPRKWPWKSASVTGAILITALTLFVARPHHVNPQAQIAVDSARVAMDNQSKDTYDHAIQEYRSAIELDPNWAEPWAELAYAYAAAGNARYIDGEMALREARRAAGVALQIDSRLAKAHAALGWTQSLDFDDWPKAESAFLTALRLSPEDGQIHYWFGVHLRKKGRFNDAEQQDELALRLTHQRDPSVWCELAFLYWTSGNIIKLHQHLQEQLKAFPNYSLTRFLYARLLKLEGNYEEAEKQLEFAEQLDLNPFTALVERASLAVYKGDTVAARRYIDQLVEASHTNEVDGLLLAGVYAKLGENDTAFAVLETAYKKKDNTLLSLATSPVLEPLRKDPRFTSLLQRLHFID
ncbi:MAG TPA: protein kinase [Candidatus Angelobacter sp.]|jgi:serine/threonine protein kinase